jgi:hypothetical protein
MGQHLSGLDRPLLNLSGGKDSADIFTLRDMFENVAITGSTGSGKTSGSAHALASALLNAQGIHPEERVGLIVFLYKKGEAEDWLRLAWEHGRENDLLHIEAHHANVFNLLERYQHQEPMNAVGALMAISQLSLSGGNRREGESYWEVEQSKRLDRLIRLNQLAGLPLSVETLYRIHVSAPVEPDQLHRQDFRDGSLCWQLLTQAAERAGEQHPGFRLVEDYFLREMPLLADRTSSSIRAMASSVLEPFVSSQMLGQLFGGTSTLRLEDAFCGKIILLDIPVQQHEHAGRVAQVMFKYAFQKAVEQRDLKRHPNPVIFWQDEAQAFLTPFDHAFLSTCRSSRAGSVLLSQNLSNFYAALGGGPQAEAQVNSLLALCNTKVFHANNDHITNEWAAKTIGMGLRNLSSISISHHSDSATSSQHLQYLVEPREFTMLRSGGARHHFLVDAVITGTGRVFSTDVNFLPTTFKQPSAR